MSVRLSQPQRRAGLLHMIRLTFLLAALFAAASAGARDAAAWLLDGRRLRGALETAAPHLVLRSAGGEPVTLAWTNLGRLQLAEMPPAPERPAASEESFAGWEARGVGEGATGRHEVEGARLRLHATGAGLRGTDDAAWFVHRVLEGDTELFARLESFSGGTTNAFAGLMIRDNPGAATAFAALGLRGDGRIAWQVRNMPAATATTLTNAPAAAPVLLRLARQGATVRAAWSATGTNWTALGEVPVNLGARSRVGFVVAGGDAATPAEAAFEALALGGGLAGLGGVHPRLVLRDGSVLVAPVEGADASAVRLGGAWAGTAVSLGRIARIEYQPLPPDRQADLDPARPGALLGSGDFLEGRLRRADSSTATVDSLVFGPRRLKSGAELILVQVAAPEPAPGAFTVTTGDGSELHADALEVRGDRLRVEGAGVGELQVPLARVTGLRRNAGTER
ncbi:MAG: hypothetical protein ACKVYV_01790 [Limisphaerales bacterium]